MGFEHWRYTVPLRLRSLFRRALVEQELEDEIRDHAERLRSDGGVALRLEATPDASARVGASANA